MDVLYVRACVNNEHLTAASSRPSEDLTTSVKVLLGVQQTSIKRGLEDPFKSSKSRGITDHDCSSKLWDSLKESSHDSGSLGLTTEC